MNLTVHMALVFHVFIAVAITVVAVMVCGCHGIGPRYSMLIVSGWVP